MKRQTKAIVAGIEHSHGSGGVIAMMVAICCVAGAFGNALGQFKVLFFQAAHFLRIGVSIFAGDADRALVAVHNRHGDEALFF